MAWANAIGGTDILLETGPETVRCYGQPRNAVAVVVGLLVLGVSLLPVVNNAMPLIAGAAGTRGWRDGDAPVIFVSALPFLMVLIVLCFIYQRRRMRRGFEIVDGVITLYTPGSTVGQHVLDRSNLGGAELVRAASGGVDFRILRRNGSPIPVFLGYDAAAVGPAVDAVNRLVVDGRASGFEVIPLARIAPPTAAPADDPPL